MPVSSTSELMSALRDEGLLRRSGLRRYRLGWRVLAMNKVLMETEYRAEARRAMEYLASRLVESTVHLAALERGQVIYLERVEGRRAVRLNDARVGSRFAAHASGVGKVLLAHRPWAEVVEILDEQGMPALTPQTITGLEGLRQEIERVRARGYAHNLEEGQLNLCCVAAPVKDFGGEVIAAISLSFPASQFERGKEYYHAALVGASRTLSENVGAMRVERRSLADLRRVPPLQRSAAS